MYDFRTFSFGCGKHKTRDYGMCVMEAVAYLGEEDHSDRPKCASAVIGKLVIWLNDSLDDKRRREWMSGMPYRLVGTAATPEIEHQRAFMAADWAVRVVYPRVMEIAGLKDQEKNLRDLPVIDSEESSRAAAAAAAADAARWAAAAAAAAANWAAAAAAGWAAAAAADAAADDDADDDDADDDLEFIQRSCLDLIDRMIRLTEIREVVPQKECATAEVVGVCDGT